MHLFFSLKQRNEFSYKRKIFIDLADATGLTQINEHLNHDTSELDKLVIYEFLYAKSSSKFCIK